MTVDEYLDNAKFVSDNLQSEVSAIVYANEVEIINLNTEEQLFKRGIGIDGSILGQYKTNSYPEIGSSLRGYPKNRGDKYNFLKTGTLFNDINIELNGYKLTITNSDSGNKISSLLRLTGQDFIGLTEENQQRLNYEIIKPKLDEFIKKYL
jgi:hypothetical protein